MSSRYIPYSIFVVFSCKNNKYISNDAHVESVPDFIFQVTIDVNGRLSDDLYFLHLVSFTWLAFNSFIISNILLTKTAPPFIRIISLPYCSLTSIVVLGSKKYLHVSLISNFSFGESRGVTSNAANLNHCAHSGITLFSLSLVFGWKVFEIFSTNSLIHSC